MKKILLVLTCLCGSLYAYPTVSQDLSHAVSLIHQFPEGRGILQKVEEEGPICIYSSPFESNSNAMWNQTNRQIVINSQNARSFGQKLRSIFFELHNAMATKEFNRIDNLAIQGKISKRDYIRAIEHLEYKNALKTKTLIEKAISRNLFPTDSYWDIPTSFETHLNYQIQTGHAAAIAVIYDHLNAWGSKTNRYAYLSRETR